MFCQKTYSWIYHIRCIFFNVTKIHRIAKFKRLMRKAVVVIVDYGNNLVFAICPLVNDLCHHCASHFIEIIIKNCFYLQTNLPSQVYNQVTPSLSPSPLVIMASPTSRLLLNVTTWNNDVVLQVCYLSLSLNFLSPFIFIN